MPQDATTPQDPWRPGAVVGEHVLEHRLGAGGFGVVDLARHTSTGALRAIKSLPLLRGDPELLLRFQREGEALARLDDAPGVVRVHATGEAHGRRYLVMQYLSGGDLDARLRRGPLPAAEVVALGVKLARALQRAHDLGVLHRDLKPANVLFSEADEPVLVDFGLARLASAEQLTASGELLGTPAYMAPEQVRGDRAALGPATDVYGLGALLFRALTGRAPAEGATAIEVLGRVLSGPPAVEALVPDAPPALSAALSRALARRPADRFPSAALFADALAALSLAPRRARAWLLLLPAAAIALAAGVALVPDAPTPVAPPPRATTAPVPTPVAPAPPAPAPAVWRGLPRTVDEIPPVGAPPFVPTEAEANLLEGGAADLLLAEQVRSTAGILRGKERKERLAYATRVIAHVARGGGVECAMAWRLLGQRFKQAEGVVYSASESVACLQRSAALGNVDGELELARARVDRAVSAVELEAARDALLPLLTDPRLNDVQAAFARHTLALIAERDERVVGNAQAAAYLGGASGRRGEMRLLRARLLARLHDRDGAKAELLPELGAEGDFPGEALAQLAALFEGTPEGEEYVARLRAGESASYRYALGAYLLRGPPDAERIAEASRLLQQVAQRYDSDSGRRDARIKLFHLRRAGVPGGTLEEAKELVLQEPDGVQLLEAISR